MLSLSTDISDILDVLNILKCASVVSEIQIYLLLVRSKWSSTYIVASLYTRLVKDLKTLN